MNGDSYKIIISISHHRISFEYWQRDGENKLVPLPNGNWPAPLAFYCSDTGIIIGEDAVRAAHSGTTNAFDNYFERLVEDSTYTIGGQTRPIRNLLLDASESIFRDFFRHVLFSRFGSLSDNRANMPLTLVCESDIKPNERALLQGLFKDSGYNRVRVVDYDRYINRYINESLSNEYVCDKVVVAWAEGPDLTFSIFGVNNDTAPVVRSFENLGIDPRKKYVEKMIWDRVIGQNPWLQRSNEEDAISKAASDFLSSSLPLVNETILLSDGQQYHYSLNRNTIDYIQNSDGVSIKDVLDQFLRENGIINRSRVLLLLRGIVAGNSYFEQNLSPGFSKAIKTDKKLRDNTMSLIISEVTPALEAEQIIVESPVFVKPPQDNENQVKIREISKKWRRVKAEANGKQRSGQTEVAIQMLKDFLSECQSFSGVDNVISEISNEISKCNLAPEPVAINHDLIKSLDRQWREVKATAKGKIRSGNLSDARSILQSFLNTLQKEPGTDSLISSVQNELSLIAADEPKQSKSKHKDGDIHPNGKWVWVASAANGNGDWRVIGGRIHTQSKQEKEIKTEHENEGKSLIAQGRLKDARDWYRAQNNNAMARILFDIIRSQKGVELRKTSIEEYRKSKNREQISRIIKEIEEYIDLCEKAGLNSSEYKKLLADYRKI